MAQPTGPRLRCSDFKERVGRLSDFYVINSAQMWNLWLHPLFLPREWADLREETWDQAPNQPAPSAHRVGARNKPALGDVIIIIVIIVSMLIYWQMLEPMNLVE